MARPYRSSQRDRAAAHTRNVILEAAEHLFTERGFAQTTVADIAQRADVAVTTVYGSVGSKSGIVLALMEQGTKDPLIEETAERVRRAATPEESIDELSAGVCATIQKLLPLVAVMYDTAPSDPLIAEAVTATEAAYRTNLAPLAHHLRQNEWLKPELTEEDVLDILWFYFGMPALRTLHDLGWSWDRTREWLSHQATAALVAR